MEISDWTNIIECVAIVYFGWQQNQIFRHQNQIFATQGGQTAMPSKVSKFDWLRRYWPSMIMVMLLLVTGFDIYDRHHGFGYDPNRAWDTHKPLERIYQHTFVNETVVLDGKQFIQPTFDNVTFVYNGTGGVGMDTPAFINHAGVQPSRLASRNLVVASTMIIAAEIWRGTGGCPNISVDNKGPQGTVEGVTPYGK